TRSGWIAAVRGRKEIGVSGAKFAGFGLRPAKTPPLARLARTGRFVAAFLAAIGRARLPGFPAARALRSGRLLRLAIRILPWRFAAMVFRPVKRVKLHLTGPMGPGHKSRPAGTQTREDFMRKHAAASAALATLAFAFATPSFAQERTVKITGFGAKSGVVRVFGINSEAAMKAAAEEINKAGGVTLGDGTKAKLTVDFLDDRCNAEEGISVVRRIASTDAFVAVGP